MEATKNQYELARCVVRRNEERFNYKLSRSERRINQIFYWVMELIFQKIENMEEGFAARKHKVELVTGETRIPVGDSNLTEKVFYIREVNVDKYLNIRLPEKQFYAVLEDVASIFNTLPNYHATYNRKDNSTAELSIFMDIP